MAIASGADLRFVAEHATHGVEIHTGIDHLAGRAVPQIVQSCVAHARAARTAAGLTQTQAAALIYCTLRGWQDWEAGKRAMHQAFFELFLLKLKACGAQK